VPSTLPPAIARALERAGEDAARPAPSAARARPRGRLVAMGDPQAPLVHVLSVLDAAGLLGGDGRLNGDTHLVSIGDHFDWGSPEERAATARDGHALLSWLAAHPPDQVTLLLGNHDLARVGELVHFDDAGYQAAREEADVAYRAPAPDRAREDRFRSRHPEIPTSECLARDFSSFSVAQRERVAQLLAARRFCVALACGPGLLLSHAGLTGDDVAVLGLRADASAEHIAGALDDRLDGAVAGWDGRTPLAIPGLHRPGSGARGESRGIFSHRPSSPDNGPRNLFEGTLRRRFDPRRLPAGLTQVVGHSSDAKCRDTLQPWVAGPPAPPGGLRSLVATGDAAEYRAALQAPAPGAARMVFIDGGMAHCPAESYELLDPRRLGPT